MAESSETTPGPALQRTAGPWLLWALGVGYVISGDYFGWNFGLRDGGLGGMAIATAIMAVMYGCLIFTIAELATAMPVAGGPFAFARRAFGRYPGFLVGLAVALEYAIAPAVIAAGIAGYVGGLLGDPSSMFVRVLPIMAYAVCVAINLAGSHVSLRALLVVTLAAALALVLWAIAIIVHAPAGALAIARPSSAMLPGVAAIAAALPAAGWFFLAIEGVPMAAEEARDPTRDLPRGMIAAMLTLAAFAALILWLAPAAAGQTAIAGAGNPLPVAIEAVLGRGAVFVVITAVGLVGLFASMLSIVFAYSRQIYALARAGYLPPWLARTSARGVPTHALIGPALLGLLALELATRFGPVGVPAPDLLMQVAVFAALLSYVAIAASHLVLGVRAPELARPYRTPGGRALPIAALLLALLALLAAVGYGVAAATALAITLSVLAAGSLYFVVRVRARVGRRSVDEELALVRRAEQDV
jgi:ethanolamine permease